MARKKKLTIDKYNYGSYVIINQQRGEPATPKTNVGGSAMSGLASGASMGSAFGPWGTLIGGVVGGIGGLISGNAKNKRRQREQRRLDLQSLNSFTQQYNANIDSVNENPYGTYADGGDVPITQINIEKGELQVDPETGKIIREYTGINPETGGLYEPHAKKGKDTKNNFVTAEEGSFIITKAKAKQYKDALDNNDKLQQNTIMHNIRNKKRQSMKFANGGKVIDPVTTFAGVNPSLSLTTDTRNLIAPVSVTGVTATKPNTGPAKLAPLNLNVAKTVAPQQTQSGINWGNVATNAINYLPAITNLFQGFSSPNYLNNQYSPANPYKNQILGNMPRDINYSPLLNRIYRDRNTAYGVIDNTTNSSAVARANKLNVMANTQRGIQDMYFQGEDMNNRIRMQRAGMYDSLGQQELARFDADRRFNYGVDMTNRQMAEGRREQVNYGLSQLQQMYQTNLTNKQLENRDNMRTNILKYIAPALLPYLDDIYGIGGTNGKK